ncbi:Ff.00g074050.m01.CDS01 [Fusarium sp. VM40]|nr:Ff.00g074050.m01.CDS01 [Fusarium sp. VM40]
MASTTPSSDPGPVYFWRETDPEVGYLSQWYYCPFRDDQDEKKTYKTAEHYLMHQKALVFNDQDIAAQILKTGSPRKVKSLGRKVKNFDEKTWLKHRRDVARRGNILKFTRAITEEGFKRGTPNGNTAADSLIQPIESSLLDTLLSTGDRDLVEASPFDRIWGIGFRAADAETARDAWGENLLGKELMEVRRILRERRDKGEA